MSVKMSLCKKSSSAFMRYENDYCCIAFAHDYGGIITGLVVVKNENGKIFTSPHLNIKLEDLKKVNGEGYKIQAGNRIEIIPPKLVHRFVSDVQKEILIHRQDVRKKRKNRK